MTGHYQTQYAIGDRVRALGLPAVVVAITFSDTGTQYRVRFDAGGATSVLDGAEIGKCER
jgi:hypothetical protein